MSLVNFHLPCGQAKLYTHFVICVIIIPTERGNTFQAGLFPTHLEQSQHDHKVGVLIAQI